MLMTRVGLRLWGWVKTLSAPSLNRFGRRMSLGCCWTHCWLWAAHCVCSFHSYVYMFPNTDICVNIYDYNTDFHFRKESRLFFQSSGKWQYRLMVNALSYYSHNAVPGWRPFFAFIMLNTVFMPSALFMESNLQGCQEQARAEGTHLRGVCH